VAEETEKTETAWLVWGCGFLTALAWAAAHIAMQGPRGWPSWELGEWEVMLVVEALFAGQPLDLPVGAVHGHGLGSYLLALLVVPLRWLGLSPLLAAKTAATVLGATTAGVCGGTAAALGQRRAGPAAGVLAAVIFGAVAAVSWPSWHQELGGISGRTPDAILPSVAGALLLLRWPSPSLNRTALAGVFLGIAWVLSPASIWIVGLALGATLMPGEARWPARCETLLGWLPLWTRRPAVLLSGLALPALFLALLAPAGAEGLSAFLSKQANQVTEALAGQAGTHPTATGERGPIRALMAVPEVLGGAGDGVAPPLVSAVLSNIGWLVLLSALFALALALARRRLSTEALLSVAALSFVFPLGLVATGPADLGAAARYFIVPLCLALVGGSVALASEIRRFPRLGWAPGVLAVVLALLPITSLDTLLLAPSWTLEESLMSTGAHGLPVFPGEGRHSAFRSLLRGVPPEGRAAFVEGYGMDLGGEAALELWEARAPSPIWEDLLEGLSPKERSALLIGVGCGLSRLGLDGFAFNFLTGTAADQQSDLFYGIGLCAYDRSLTRPVPILATEADLANLPELALVHLLEGRGDAERPFPRTPRRSTVAVPAERMRALPPPPSSEPGARRTPSVVETATEE